MKKNVRRAIISFILTIAIASSWSCKQAGAHTDQMDRASPATKPPSALDVHPSAASAQSEERPEGMLAKAISDTFPDNTSRSSEIIKSLRDSGDALPGLQASGEMLSAALSHQGYIEADWKCYRIGCYFRFSRYSANDEQQLIRTREANSPGHPMMITPEDVPNKLLVLLP